MTDISSPEIQKIIESTGEKALLIVAFLLFVDFLGVFSLQRSGIPYINVILWAYLLLNIGLVNVFKFMREKDNPTCPQCRRKLKETKGYECPKCGKLRYENK